MTNPTSTKAFSGVEFSMLKGELEEQNKQLARIADALEAFNANFKSVVVTEKERSGAYISAHTW